MKISLLAIVFGVCMCLVSCTPPSSTVSLVYSNVFSQDTIVTLEKVPMVPAQLNPRCLLFSNERVLVRTSTVLSVILNLHILTRLPQNRMVAVC